MAVSYPITAPATEEADIIAMFNLFQIEFPGAQLETDPASGDFRISVEGGEPFMRIH